MNNPDKIVTGDFEFTREDARILAKTWRRFAYGKHSGSYVGDDLGPQIEELMLAWGYSIEEVRETWKNYDK